MTPTSCPYTTSGKNKSNDHHRAHYAPQPICVTAMTAPPVPPDDEQLERQAATGELPVAAADDDECLTSAEGMPTQVAPPIPDDDKPPTMAAPFAFAEAYSEELPEQSGRSWRVAWRVAAIMVIAALALAAAAWFGLRALLDRQGTQPSAPSTTVVVPPPVSPSSRPLPPSTVTVVPPPPPSTVTVVPPPPPSTVTVVPPQPPASGPSRADQEDRLFIERLHQAGIIVYDVPAGVASARQVCVELRQGTASKQSEADVTRQNIPGLTPTQVVAMIDATTGVYCPDQYGPWTYYY